MLIFLNIILGDRESTLKSERKKGKKKSDVFVKSTCLCFVSFDFWSFVFLDTDAAFLYLFFSLPHTLFFPFFLCLGHTHSLYLFIANSRAETVSETGQYKIIPSIAHTHTHTHTHTHIHIHTHTNTHTQVHTHTVACTLHSTWRKYLIENSLV